MSPHRILSLFFLTPWLTLVAAASPIASPVPPKGVSDVANKPVQQPVRLAQDIRAVLTKFDAPPGVYPLKEPLRIVIHVEKPKGDVHGTLTEREVTLTSVWVLRTGAFFVCGEAKFSGDFMVVPRIHPVDTVRELTLLSEFDALYPKEPRGIAGGYGVADDYEWWHVFRRVIGLTADGKIEAQEFFLIASQKILPRELIRDAKGRQDYAPAVLDKNAPALIRSMEATVGKVASAKVDPAKKPPVSTVAPKPTK